MGNFLAEHFDMIGYCRDKRKLNRETIMEDQLKRHSEQLKESCIKHIAELQGMLEDVQKHYDERKALLQEQIIEIREIITKIDKKLTT